MVYLYFFVNFKVVWIFISLSDVVVEILKDSFLVCMVFRDILELKKYYLIRLILKWKVWCCVL